MSGCAATPVPSGTVAPTEALWRAMPVTRQLDCGMVYDDVLQWQRLTADGVPWDEAGERLGLAARARAESAAAAGHLVTAHVEHRRAAACFLFAQMAFNFDVPRKVALYAEFSRDVGAAGRLATPRWERVQLDQAAGKLHGWLVRPDGPAHGTVIVFGGQSGWGAAYLGQADALAARGLATLLVEGPGQGESRFSGIYLDEDVPAAYGAFVDWVKARPELGGGVGLWGNSLGGLYAALTAAARPDVTAVCVNGSPAVPRLKGMRTFDEQAAAMLGDADPTRVQANLDRLALAPDATIDGAVLVLHGGADPIVDLTEQQPFLAAARTADATLRVWDDGEHTIYNHAAERTAFVADWFADRLASARTEQ